MHFKKCVIYNSVLEDNFLYKHQLLYLCHTCSIELYEMHSGKYIQQLMKVKGSKYFQHSNYSTHTIKEGMFF
jgi:hypothetical protein